MTNKKSTKRALLASVVALMLCVAMLAGTTYAWFTDSVVSNNNIIKSGNLDVELYWSTDASNWEKVDATTNVFKDSLWEPGHTEVVYLKVVNEGSLALKYNLGVNIVSETAGKNAAGEIFKLSNYIEFGAIETNTAFENRDAARAAVVDGRIISSGYSKGSSLTPKDKGVSEEYVALVVYMPETVGNEANYKTGTAEPTINLGINLFATQYTYEEDSYGSDYDKDSLPCDVIATPENINEVLAAAQPGDVIGLADGAYYDMSIVIPCDDITLVSNTAIADHVNVNGMDNVKLIGITFDARDPHSVVYPKGTSTIRANITSTDGAKGPENLQILNCKFVDLYGVSSADASPSPYCPIAIYDRNRVTGATNGIIIDGCTFDTNAAYYVYMYYPGDPNINPVGDIIIRNNTFGNANTTVGTAVYVGGTKNNVSVLENTLTNGSVVVAPHNNASCTYSLKVSVIGNNFVNTSDVSMNAIALRNFHSLPKCNTIVKDNVANYGASELSAAYIDSKSYECYDVNGGEVIGVNVGETAALATPNKVFVLGSGDYGKISAIGEGTTIIGNGETTFATHQNALPTSLNNVTFKNVNLSGNNVLSTGTATGDVTFENCVIKGANYGIHFDSGIGENKITFKNCDITGFTTFAASIEEVVFEGCNFHKPEHQRGQLNIWGGKVSLIDCHFDADWYLVYICGDATINIDNVTYGGDINDFYYVASGVNPTWNFLDGTNPTIH